MNPPRTLYAKLWDEHFIRPAGDGLGLLYIDRHLLHEVSTPQAFEGLHLGGRKVWRIDANLAVADHNVPTTDPSLGVSDPASLLQLRTLSANCARHGIAEFPLGDPRQGIVHVVGPEQGFTLPGMTVVCGDSHTATHGALGCLAFGIGTSEVEHVLATQTLVVGRARTMEVSFRGALPAGVTSKDLALALIGRIGTAGATGHVIEFRGAVIRALSMEGRMSLCNMAIEAGARAGMIGVDDTTIGYCADRPYAPTGELRDLAIRAWRGLVSDAGAPFDRRIEIEVDDMKPQVTWGTSPEMVADIDAAVPDPGTESDPVKSAGMRRALQYMGLAPGTPLSTIAVDKVFIGSCTNSRIEDLRAAAAVVRGRRVAPNVRRALVVPGSGLVKRMAEAEALHRVFLDAGFEWREPGCSMCVGMNEDRLGPGERCASTSNRNFEGRQGAGGRTHLMSPPMAAAAAITGRVTDVRMLMLGR